ncbi:helix-turn-helix domain-containing protein [Chroococcidiopsis sp. CCMEE 29]|uniref:AraC family transcriptional regulator n=1 Tax=Chroococcidiopsis sp. CCMEE 29 TaxID=155894 RepID=UPI002020360D|nr:helix-turn-helix domain-containing protein [Chroococcidiopsis sp. CCMEE 29]
MTETESTTPEFTSTAELFEVLPEQPTVSSQPYNWTGIVAQQYHHRPNRLISPQLQQHLVTLNFGSPYTLTQQFEGRTQQARVVKGNMILTPAGRATEWHWQNNVNVLHLRLDPAFVDIIAEQVLEIDSNQVELVHQFSVPDPMTEQLGQALLMELLAEHPSGHLYVDSLTNVLVAHLLKHHSATPRVQAQHTLGLPPYKLQQAIDYIQEHLEIDITLADIAAQVGMSPYYFARQFKQSTGVSPHQYHTHTKLRSKR